jgi:hypothetical protein
MKVTAKQFFIISKNCPFRSKYPIEIYGKGTTPQEKFHVCDAKDVGNVGAKQSKCSIKNCAIAYWADAIVNIEDDK